MSKANGNSHNPSNLGSGAPCSPQGDMADTPTNGAILHLHESLHDLGRKRALSSGTTKPLPEDLRALEAHARAMAHETYRDRFNPAQNEHDRMLQVEYESHLEQRSEAQQGEAHARASLRDAEAAAARTPKAGEKPVVNRWTVVAFIVAITITVAPTLHDFVFHALSDDLLAWFGALISASFIGCMLTFAILSGRRTAWRWAGGAAGVILGVGLGAIRLSSAESIGEAAFAVGLTIVEIAAVLLLEWLASGLRASEERWSVVKVAEDAATATHAAAEAELSRWQSKIQELNTLIAGKIAYIEDRFNRNVHLPELEAVAVNAVLDGYNAGIGENIGRLRGVRSLQ